MFLTKMRAVDGLTGKFITLEGGDGAGKSTQSKLLAAYLESRSKPVVLTREPGGAAGADDIRALLVTGDPERWDAIAETLLFYAARRNHLRLTIWPAMQAGKWVISDRFADSTMAYQGYGNRLGLDAVTQVHEFTVGDFKPDLTFLLDLPARTGLARTRGRGDDEDRFEKMELEFHVRLREGFLEMAAAEPSRFVIIDADRPEQEIQAQIRDVISQRYAL